MMLGRFDRGDVSKKFRVPDHRAMHTQGGRISILYVEEEQLV